VVEGRRATLIPVPLYEKVTETMRSAVKEGKDVQKREILKKGGERKRRSLFLEHVIWNHREKDPVVVNKNRRCRGEGKKIVVVEESTYFVGKTFVVAQRER